MKDYFGFKDKVCVVTGGASGIGKAVTEILVELGAVVYAMDINEVKVPGIKNFVKVSLGEKESIDAAFKALPGKLDCFFGVAGVSGHKTDANVTMAINFFANKYMVEEYVVDRIQESGTIGFVSSGSGASWWQEETKEEYISLIKPKGWEATYQAWLDLKASNTLGKEAYFVSKRALNYYTIYMGKQLASKKIRINAVLPGPSDTGLAPEFASAFGGDTKMLGQAATGGAKRLAQPIEVAMPLIFLSSDMASYISAALLPVDFGMTNEFWSKLVIDWFAGRKLVIQ